MTETNRIKRLFRDAIRRGTGRAHLLMRAHPEVNFGPDILKAACTNYAYDPQCEDSRGHYLLELIALLAPATRQAETVRQILAALVAARKATWGLLQLFDLAGRLAEAGNAAARTAFYHRFELSDFAEYAYSGEYELVRLDGLAGLLRVATVRGRYLADDDEERESDYLIELAQKKTPEADVVAELTKAAATNSYIARYFQAVREGQEKFRQTLSRKKPNPLYRVQQAIANTTTNHISFYVIRRLTARQLRLLATDFQQQTSHARQARYLLVFSHRKYPLSYEPLLKLAATANPKHKSRTADDAIDALRFFQAPAIREFALTKLADPSVAWRYADLFINNYQTGDDQLLLRLVEQTTGEGAIESLAISLCAIYQKNRTKKCREPLRAIYQRMNCGMHRADVVALLLKRGVLPADIREEIPFDSYENVRELAVEQPQ